MAKNTKRYSVKMEKMILKAYANASENQSSVGIARQLKEDFQRIFSYNIASKLTPNGIAQKYYTLRQRNTNTDKHKNVKSKVHTEVTQKPKSTLKDNIFKAIKEHNSKKASEAMLKHLIGVRKAIMKI